jgi:hypothetical protein
MTPRTRRIITPFGILAVLGILGIVLICGCLDAGTDTTITATGSITYIDLEGGFYGIVASDGTRYLPLNLPDAFRQDGLAVTFTGTPEPDVATIQQWGTPITLSAIAGDGISWQA